MGEFVAIYVRATGKNTNDGVEKKLLHKLKQELSSKMSLRNSLETMK